MLKWSPYPFVRYCIVLICGILIGEFFQNSESEKISFLALLAYFTYILAGRLFKRNTFTRFRILIGVLGLSSIFLTGLFRSVEIHERNRQEEISADIEKISNYSAWIQSPPIIKNGSIRFEALITAIQLSEVWYGSSSSVSIYYLTSDENVNLNYGDRILVTGNPEKVKSPVNQYVFNYQKWLSRNGIIYQDFLKEGSLLVYENTPPSRLMQVSHNLRKTISNIISSSFDDPVTAGIVSALVIGQRENLDPGIADDFARSGVYHILAVSGLHVGIIYFILMIIFGRLSHSKSGRWVFAVITLITLMIYSILTGLSPSVIRAATMLSLIPLSQAINRKANIFNTIAFSAFINLLYNPFLIYSAGFQLSYLAVLGIVIFYKPIYSLFEINSFILDRVWKLWSVSIAAQIMTFPLTIHYFNQFPVVFLFSNIIMIPVAFITVISGFLLISLHPITVLANLISTILHFLITSATTVIQFLNKLQGNIFSNIYLSFSEAGLLYIALVSVTLLFFRKKIIYLYLSVIAILFFTVNRTSWIYDNKGESKLMVYYLSGNRGVEFVNGLKGILILDPNNSDNEKIVKNLINPVCRKQARDVDMAHNDRVSSDSVRGINFHVWQSNTLAIINDPSHIPQIAGFINVDVVIIKPHYKMNHIDVFRYIKANHWVFSGWVRDDVSFKIDSLSSEKDIKIYYPIRKGFSEINL